MAANILLGGGALEAVAGVKMVVGIQAWRRAQQQWRRHAFFTWRADDTTGWWRATHGMKSIEPGMGSINLQWRSQRKPK